MSGSWEGKVAGEWDINAYNFSEEPAVALVGVANDNVVADGEVEIDLIFGLVFDLRSSKILVSINDVSSSIMEFDLFLDDITSDVDAEGGGVGVEDDTFEWVVVVEAVLVDAVCIGW